jgi:hypothetical protein
MVNFGNNTILFGDSDCPACLYQVKTLNDYYNKIKKKANILYYNLGVHKPPKEIMDSEGNYSMPTWYFPGTNKLVNGVVEPKVFNNYSIGNKSRFGAPNNSGIPQVGTLKEYGKSGSFNVNKSWSNELSDKWNGNPIASGTLGRLFGPGKTDNIYNNEYLNDIRGRRPGDDLDSVLENNVKCNMLSKDNNKSFGIVGDSDKQQQVPMTNFGKKNKRKPRFGSSGILRNTSPAYSTNKQLTTRGGGTTKESGFVPDDSKFLYSDYSEYNPIDYGKVDIATSFGKRKKKNSKSPKSPGTRKNKIGEGTVMTIKNNKIKYS